MSYRHLKPVFTLLLTFSLAFAAVACSSGGDEVEDAPPAETPDEQAQEADEVDDPAEEAAGEENRRERLVKDFSPLLVLASAEVRADCQCGVEAAEYSTYEDCVAELDGGISDSEDPEECLMESFDTMGDPPQEIFEYVGCISPLMETGIECVNEELEAESCDRYDDPNSMGLIDSCLADHDEELSACENVLAGADEEVMEWMSALEEPLDNCW